MLLSALFFIVALFYSSVGFGGGSSYLALLILWDMPFHIIPIIALLCNITVVTGNSVNYIKAGYSNWKLFLSVSVLSVPMAYLGGSISIDKLTFQILLASMLLITGGHLLFQHRTYADSENYKNPPVPLLLFMGAILGFMAGIVGIGGGIFLAPILYVFKAGSPKQIATTSSIFILVNSIAGLIGHLQKGEVLNVITDFWYLPVLVLVAGQIGNHLTLRILPSKVIALFTALLVIFVSIRLWLSLILI